MTEQTLDKLATAVCEHDFYDSLVTALLAAGGKRFTHRQLMMMNLHELATLAAPNGVRFVWQNQESHPELQRRLAELL